MHIIRTSLLSGAAALLLSGASVGALAKGPQTHVMTVRLPGGDVEEIRYSGDVRPQVTVSPGDAFADLGWPAAFFGPDSTFAQMDRISAAMDRQMGLMMRNAEALAAEPALATGIDQVKLPPGMQSYSLVSSMSGNGICGRSVEITSRGDGQKPQVVSKTWGNCGRAQNGAGANSPASPANQPSGIREIRYNSPAPSASIREAGLF